MSWPDAGYGVVLTIVVGAVLAALTRWREIRDHRAAEAERRRLDALGRTARRRPIAHDLDRHRLDRRHLDRAA